MVRIHDCKGIPITSLKNGERLGYLDNALYDENNLVKGFIVETEGNISFKINKNYIYLEDILKLNKEICVIYSRDNIHKYKSKSNLKTSCELDDVIGKDVLSENGNNIGVIKDIIFDLGTGALEGLEISKGFVNDLVEGKNVIFLRDGVEFAEEYVIAKGEVYSE